MCGVGWSGEKEEELEEDGLYETQLCPTLHDATHNYTRPQLKHKRPANDREKRKLEADLAKVRNALKKSIKEQAQVISELDARDSRIRDLEQRVQGLKRREATQQSRIPQPRVHVVQDTPAPGAMEEEIAALREEAENWRTRYNELDRRRAEDVGGSSWGWGGGCDVM